MNNEQLDILIKEAEQELISIYQKQDEIEYFNSIDKYGDPIPVLADFEHAYLFDGERQLKLAFNPKV